MLAALPMAADLEALVLGFIPRVDAPLIVQPRLYFRRVVGENRKRGHTIVPIVLILVIAPDHAEVRLEFIQFPARSPKAFDHVTAMGVGMSLAFVGSPLPAHRLGPIFHRMQALWQRWVSQAYLDAPAQISLNRKARIMSDAQTKYLSHGLLLSVGVGATDRSPLHLINH